MDNSAAELLRPLFTAIFGPEIPIRIRFWDASSLGSGEGNTSVVVRSPNALRRIMYAPGELGLGRAYILGEVDIEGDLFEALRVMTAANADAKIGVKTVAGIIRAARTLGAFGMPLPPPQEEVRLRGWRHSKERDARAISSHYDVGNDFYRLILGETMTYSCARFEDPDDSLDTAQRSKYDLICRKLGLNPGSRLLDVGCGWGGLAMYAAEKYGVQAVGITVSRQQQDLARKRVAESGLTDMVDIRFQDYRDLKGEKFDAISSVGMFEHVGEARLKDYFAILFESLNPKGRLLNHAISTPEGATYGNNSFIQRYVFPDGELQDVATVAAAMQQAGFEVRDVEALREHYALTLRKWVSNLQNSWDQAEKLVGSVRARIWQIYMAGAAVSFETAEIGIHQVLGVKLDAQGGSGMPRTRKGYV